MLAAYDAVDKLGSLVVRLILQPFEESAAIYFSINLKRVENSTNTIPVGVANTFLLLIRVIFTFGILVFIYGSSYASLAAELYGGRRFIENQGDMLLFYYSIYLPVIAVNGLSECFTVAMLDAQKLFSHSLFFTICVCIHIPLSFFSCEFFGAKGFIFANIMNSLFRICYNWRYINAALTKCLLKTSQIYSRLIPSFHFLLMSLFSWIITFFMPLILFAEPNGFSSKIIHAFIGILMLAPIAYAFYRNDHEEWSKMAIKIK